MKNDLIHEITAPETLHTAWRKVRSNQGESRIDALALQEFERDLEGNLGGLSESLREERYLPLPLRHASIPKGDGGTRDLAIPAICDRIAQRACVEVLTPIFERVFLPCSYAYRPRRGVADAVRQVRDYRNAGWNWILDADIRNFFGSLDHGQLMDQLRTYVPDKAVLRVVGLWLEAGALGPVTMPRRISGALSGSVSRPFSQETAASFDAAGDDWDEFERDKEKPDAKALMSRFGLEGAGMLWAYRREILPFLTRRAVMATGGVGAAMYGVYRLHGWYRERQDSALGAPQGSPLSPLLSNLYLHGFDVTMTRMGLRLVRYADDFVVCCPSQARSRFALAAARRELSRLRLDLHSEKTRIVANTESFRFLGHEFDGDGVFPVEEE